MALAAKEKKRNEEEEEEEREENFFKWRDLYAWRRRVLFSARRAREQEDEERRASLESIEYRSKKTREKSGRNRCLLPLLGCQHI